MLRIGGEISHPKEEEKIFKINLILKSVFFSLSFSENYAISQSKFSYLFHTLTLIIIMIHKCYKKIWVLKTPLRHDTVMRREKYLNDARWSKYKVTNRGDHIISNKLNHMLLIFQMNMRKKEEEKHIPGNFQSSFYFFMKIISKIKLYMKIT